MSYAYQVGASVPLDSPSYVERQADRELYDRLLQGDCCYIFNSRQMGKSSLRVRVMHRLQAVGFACVLIDPQTIGINVREEQWYSGIINELVKSLNLTEQFDFRQWWKDGIAQDLPPIYRFHRFVSQVLLVQVSQPIVIFIEEIDSFLSLSFPVRDFFIFIRSFYENRDDPAYKRLNFVFIGVTTPADLIQNYQGSDFNIGVAIELNGFTLAEAQPLLQGLEGRVPEPQATLATVLHWTGGQPFLTQKVLDLIVRRADFSLPPEVMVAQVVQDAIITNWEAQDVPQHLTTIRNRITHIEEREQGQLLGLYQRILLQGAIAADQSNAQTRLRLSGLVVQREGKLKVYNPIYQAVFNLAWVEQKLSELRPPYYAEALQAWQRSRQQDTSVLLRGQALRSAEEWARDKHLSDEDNRFLDASGELERQENKIARELAEQQLEIERQKREAVEAANKLLAGAMHKVFRRAIQVSVLTCLIIGVVVYQANQKFTRLNENSNRILKENQSLKGTIHELQVKLVGFRAEQGSVIDKIDKILSSQSLKPEDSLAKDLQALKKASQEVSQEIYQILILVNPTLTALEYPLKSSTQTDKSSNLQGYTIAVYYLQGDFKAEEKAKQIKAVIEKQNILNLQVVPRSLSQDRLNSSWVVVDQIRYDDKTEIDPKEELLGYLNQVGIKLDSQPTAKNSPTPKFLSIFLKPSK